MYIYKPQFKSVTVNSISMNLYLTIAVYNRFSFVEARNIIIIGTSKESVQNMNILPLMILEIHRFKYKLTLLGLFCAAVNKRRDCLLIEVVINPIVL